MFLLEWDAPRKHRPNCHLGDVFACRSASSGAEPYVRKKHPRNTCTNLWQRLSQRTPTPSGSQTSATHLGMGGGMNRLAKRPEQQDEFRVRRRLLQFACAPRAKSRPTRISMGNGLPDVPRYTVSMQTVQCERRPRVRPACHQMSPTTWLRRGMGTATANATSAFATTRSGAKGATTP